MLFFQQNHRQCITHGQHGGGAGGGRQTQRTGLALYSHVDNDIALGRQGGIFGTRKSNDFASDLPDARQQNAQFIGFTTIRQGNKDIIRLRSQRFCVPQCPIFQYRQ